MEEPPLPPLPRGGGPGGSPSPEPCSPWGAGVSPGSAHPMSRPGDAFPSAASIRREAAGDRAGERLGAPPPRLSPPPGGASLRGARCWWGVTHRCAPSAGLSPAASASSASSSSSASAPGRWVRGEGGGAAPQHPLPQILSPTRSRRSHSTVDTRLSRSSSGSSGSSSDGGGKPEPPMAPAMPQVPGRWAQACGTEPQIS